MKSTKDFSKGSASEDALRRAAKLDPMKRSGKERHQLYKSLSEDDPEEEEYRPVRESVLDYLDDDDE